MVDFWPGQQPLETWNAAAAQRGLYMIRAPRANPALDVNEKLLTAKQREALEAFEAAMKDEGGWVKKILGG